MKFLKSFKFSSFLLCLAAFLTACTSGNYLIYDSNEKRAPIPENEKIEVAFANEIPVIPENSVSIATVKTDPELNCSVESAMDFLTKKSREIGANFLYIKGIETYFVSRYYVFFYTITKCNIVYADFLEKK